MTSQLPLTPRAGRRSLRGGDGDIVCISVEGQIIGILSQDGVITINNRGAAETGADLLL